MSVEDHSRNPETSNEVTAQREALQELIQTDGWRYFYGYMRREFEGAGYRARMKTALASDDPTAARVADRVADEMFRLLSWPQRRIKELTGVTE